MKVRVLAFARLRELLGTDRELELPNDAKVADAWAALAQTCAELRPLAESTRFARNGTVVQTSERLHEGDELALLPPSGGG